MERQLRQKTEARKTLGRNGCCKPELLRTINMAGAKFGAE